MIILHSQLLVQVVPLNESDNHPKTFHEGSIVVKRWAQGLKINKLRVRRVKIDPKSAQMTFTDVEVICR